MIRALVIGFVCLNMTFANAAGEGYTNLAGNVIAAMPVKLVGANVVFVSGEKGKRTIPLRAFSASEQSRIKDAIDIREGREISRPMPNELKALAAEIASQRSRAQARTKAGRMTKEKFDEYCENLAGSWAHAVDEAKISEDDKKYWKGRCP